jgi:thioesterase domain-containing protein
VLDAFDHIFPDVTSQWSKFTSEPLRIHSVPGDHYTMFLEPNVQVLAQQLRAELSSAMASREATA